MKTLLIRNLRESGYSYTEISKIVGRSKKFVWKQAKDVVFSNNGRRRYFCNVTGIPKQIKLQEQALNHSKARVLAHLFFDGTVFRTGKYHFFIRYINSSKELVDQFLEDMKRVYGVAHSSFEIVTCKIKCYKISYKSRIVYEDLMLYAPTYSTSNDSAALPQQILNASRGIKIEFLRAFWEDEGSISKNRRLMADCKNKTVIMQLAELHKELGFTYGICRYREPTGWMYKLYLLKKKENLERFYRYKLFDKSIVTHGSFIGKRKIEVLKSFL